MAEETYSPKIFRPKHTRISELKAEAVKKDRRKKLTQSKFVGGAENTAHPRVISAPEMRQESEQVSLTDSAGFAHFLHPGSVTGTKRRNLWEQLVGTKFSIYPLAPSALGHAFCTERCFPQLLPYLSPPPSSHRAPAVDTWKLPCRSSKPAPAWCLALCTCPTVTAKDSTRESRYALSHAPKFRGLLKAAFARKPFPLNAYSFCH